MGCLIKGVAAQYKEGMAENGKKKKKDIRSWLRCCIQSSNITTDQPRDDNSNAIMQLTKLNIYIYAIILQ